jgi:hypothetical protein
MRLFGGRSIPAMRGILFLLSLANQLALLVTRIRLADHAHDAMPLHDLALVTDLLDRSP